MRGGRREIASALALAEASERTSYSKAYGQLSYNVATLIAMFEAMVGRFLERACAM